MKNFLALAAVIAILVAGAALFTESHAALEGGLTPARCLSLVC
jgi:hypothetical protein